ncbi:LysE family translocator [Acinetobacter sp. R933-2]|uniref:LysE family translocator n=1 Tax=Acinetobacter sp. R933-2 TaxID=2746728 RepID=UPI002578DF15|nr:LysE family translocator [Acinetobacter sp. R933-2]MDM1246797.1 LysE family translocator [Acinetobacter sp. R933-2]
MDFSAYFLYCVAVIVMIATPGPVMLLVASAGLQGGYKKALQTIFGTNLASLVLIAISVLILKGFVNIANHWFDIIKILGCLYIAYLGIQIIREAVLKPSTNDEVSSSIQGGFKQGFLVGISNPKDIIFFASFFPQFTHVRDDLDHSLILLTLTWIVLDFVTLSVVYLGFNVLAKSKIYTKILALCGAILVLVAIYGIYSVVS